MESLRQDGIQLMPGSFHAGFPQTGIMIRAYQDAYAAEPHPAQQGQKDTFCHVRSAHPVFCPTIYGGSCSY